MLVTESMPLDIEIPAGSDQRVFLMGDLHGVVNEIYCRCHDLVDDLGAKSGDTIIWLGDVGISYGYINRSILDTMSRMSEEYGFTHVIIRGNHDTRYVRDMSAGVFSAYGEMHSIRWCNGSAYVLDKYPSIIFLADEGGLYEILGRKTLVIPGAYSVDKHYRLVYGWPWEPEEQLSESELDVLIELSCISDVDAVLSHTCPYSWEPDLSEFLLDGLDQSKVDASMERALDTIWYNVMPTCKEWWFGHFHGDKDLPNGIGHVLYWSYAEFGVGSTVL